MEAITRSFISNDWVTIVLLSVLLLIAFSKKAYEEDFLDFSRIFTSSKYFTSHKRTISVLNFFSFLLFLAQGLIIALAIYFFINITDFVDFSQKNFRLYIQIFLVYNILIAVKYLIEKIIGEVFEINKLLDNYIFYKITYKNLLSIIVLPLLIIVIYGWPNSKILISSFFIIWILANLIILIKYYTNNQKLVLGNWFYFILYLCTLEITPYFILYKVFTGFQ